MDFDESKKVEVAVSENEFVEHRVGEKKRRSFSFKKMGLDAVDLAMIPVAIGVFVSLGFLFAGLFRATDMVSGISAVSDMLFR